MKTRSNGLIFSRKLYWRRIRTSQSWLCFTRQQGLMRSNVTAGSGLICGRAGREQRDGSGPTWPLRRGVAKGWVWSARVCVYVCGNKADLSFSSQLKPFTLLLHCLRSASVLGFPAPPLLHPELRHVTWRCSWSDWVTSGEGVYKVCCLACSYCSFTPSRLFVDMLGSSACASDCVKDQLSPGSHLSVTQTSYILTRCEI